jgi:hypothetical protein
MTEPLASPPVLLALCSHGGIVRTFVGLDRLHQHVAGIPAHLAERCSVVTYERIAERPAVSRYEPEPDE